MFIPFSAKTRFGDCARPQFLSIAVALLICLPGCGGSDFPETESVSGTVLLNGEPVEGVAVYFVSEKLVTQGKTDGQGHYDLVNGAVAGENKVYFSKIESDGEAGRQFAEGEGMDDAQRAAASGIAPGSDSPLKQVIPQEYSNESDPKLKFDVPNGGTDLADFKL